MQSMLQNVQFRFRLYNPDLEPEHELEGYCNCLVHQYQRKKWERRKVQSMWSKAVLYPGKTICWRPACLSRRLRLT